MEEVQQQNLSKRQLKELARVEKKQHQQDNASSFNLSKYLIIGLVVLVIGGGIFWLFRELTKSLPGEALDDLGRDHVTDISGVEYNSNPPTSGPHFAVWATRGAYDRAISDGYLIHSLEHGYIVISYNCGQKETNIDELEKMATDSAKPLTTLRMSPNSKMSAFAPASAPSEEIKLPESFKSQECKKLTEELDDLLQDFQRIIVVPRPHMPHYIALTAWTRLQTFDEVDLEAMKQFIQTYHNKGPEQTNE